MKKKTIITIVAVVSIAVAFFLILQNNKQENEEELQIVAKENAEVAVNTAIAQREKIDGSFAVNGTFLPEKRVQISAEMGGKIAAIYVEEGDVVEQGQVIARLMGDKTNVNLSNAKVNLENAISNLNRYEAAYKTGGVTAAQLDQAKLQVENARAQYESARLSSGDTKIRSKINGIVNDKMVEAGMVVAPGTPIVEVVDISTLDLKVEIDEALVNQLENEDTVQVVPSATEDTIEGRITFIAPASNGALKFPVEVTVSNSEGRLRAGMYGTAVFNQETQNDVLVIPREAFVGSVSDNQIFLIKNDTAYLTKIQTGINYGAKVQVTGGVDQGDVVVTSGQINLTDATAVEVIK